MTISQIWLLLPHALSTASFAGAFAWMWHVGTNRSEPDLYLGIAGFAALAAALIVSLGAMFVQVRKGIGRTWPWTLAHLAGLVPPLALAHNWMGSHIA